MGEWTATLATSDGRKWFGSAHTWAEIALVRLAKGATTEEALDTGNRMEALMECFGQYPLAASVFLYMHRRFGPPPAGFDGYKESGCWRLTTPDPDVRVSLYTRGSSVGVGVSRPEGQMVDPYRPPQSVTDAVLATLLDLRQPVWVRDEAFNAFGMCPGPRRDEDEGIAMDERPKYFGWAGYGVVPEYWQRFEKGKG